MRCLRTPDERFTDLSQYPFAPHYTELDGPRMHHVDEGRANSPVVLMLHGEPSWSYLYRKMITIVADAGYRAVAPDLVGFGKSDKPAERADYTYERHVDWMGRWLVSVDLREITLVCQDWGALIGLRLVVEQPQRFARVVVANGGLPTGDQELSRAFKAWLALSQRGERLDIARIIQNGTVTELSQEILRAYEAPFPDEDYKAGARVFPTLVPIRPDDPSSQANRRAWRALHRFEKPFLTAFSDEDPITRGADIFFQRLIPGAKGQPHTTIRGAGHFIQEDKGEELARVVLDFISQTGTGQV